MVRAGQGVLVNLHQIGFHAPANTFIHFSLVGSCQTSLYYFQLSAATLAAAHTGLPLLLPPLELPPLELPPLLLSEKGGGGGQYLRQTSPQSS